MKGVGFVNKVFEANGEGNFLQEVVKEVEDRFGDNLNMESCVRVKRLIRDPYRDILEKQNVAEVMGGLSRFVEGVPQNELAAVGRGERRHKL